MKKTEAQLLREYVRELMESYMWNLPPMKLTGDGGLLTPFLDVGRVALAGAMDLTNHAWGMAKIVIRTITDAMIPFFDKGYDDINQKTVARTQAIRSQFKDTFRRIEDNDDDMTILGFMFNPAAYIAFKAADLSVRAASAVSNVAATSAADMAADARATRNNLNSLLKMLKESSEPASNLYSLTEAVDQEKIEKQIAGSELAKEMRAAGEQLLKARLKDILEKIKEFDAVGSLEELQVLVGKDLKLDKIDRLKDKDEPAAEEEILNTAKKQFRDMHAAQLEREIKNIRKATFDSAENIISLYQAAADSLKK